MNRDLERQLRAPIGGLFLLIWILAVCYCYRDKEVIIPTKETPIYLYSNQAGDDLRKTVQDAINQAKESIDIVIFSLTDNTIINALKNKADEGVSVNIVHDAVATQDIGWKLGPKVKLYPYRGKGLMHYKLISIDHHLALIGSTNLTKESLTTHGNLIIGIESADIANLISKKREALSRRSREEFPPYITKLQGKTVEIYLLPDDQLALDRLLELLREAKKSIKVAIYTFTNDDIANELIEAKERGVDVKVVVDENSSKKTSAKIVKKLKKAGIPTLIADRVGLLHHKLVIVDDTTIATGSANWTKAAFNYNDDSLILIYPIDGEFLEKTNMMWDRIVKESKKSQTSRRKAE